RSGKNMRQDSRLRVGQGRQQGERPPIMPGGIRTLFDRRHVSDPATVHALRGANARDPIGELSGSNLGKPTANIVPLFALSALDVQDAGITSSAMSTFLKQIKNR